MGFATFGEGVDLQSIIQETLARAIQPLQSTDAAIVLLEAYETKLGIYDHSTADPNRPLATLAMHYAEDNSHGSVLYERIEQFEEREIYQRFGLSLTQFLSLPSDICKHVMEIAGKRLKQKADLANAVDQQNRALQGGGTP